MSKKWCVIWQEAEGEGREVEVDTEKQALALSDDVTKRGWSPVILSPAAMEISVGPSVETASVPAPTEEKPAAKRR